MTVQIVNPANGLPLRRAGDFLVDAEGHRFPVLAGVPRICDRENYTSNFGIQWNAFRETQIDSAMGQGRISEFRFFAETAWGRDELDGLDILEVGSGAGRFSEVVLACTKANLYSVDYSSAVEANFANNGAIAPDRFHLFQASVYDMPFPDNSFDSYTIAFGIRNVTHIDKALTEALRVLKPGGRFLCLEFSKVQAPVLDEIYERFSFSVIPKIGEWVAQDADSYRYLAESIRRFPPQANFKKMIEKAGMGQVKVRNLSGGIAAMHSAWKI